ncbi:hypothetical protein T12_6361 [Trichinella patagoniensis]|uniref:Uncharacterized protein n=1 Tax=Trichinella patagoniensis TaxID=990121 RepID=A0A0V0ZEE2_9BILA|nr:hypothetical protein T12_6361 [Trichinella patagoniensis]
MNDCTAFIPASATFTVFFSADLYIWTRVINGHNTNLEADDTNWAVSDPGSVICHVDKPYFKNQSKEPAMAICIENNDIFTRFNEIAAQVENLSRMDSLLDSIDDCLQCLNLFIACFFLFYFFRRIKARSKDDENDLNEPVTDVASENSEMEQSANVLNEELDRHVEQEQKPMQLVMLVQIEREKPKSGLYVEYTAEMKFRVNEESVQMYKSALKKTVNVGDAGMNAVQSFIMKSE